MRSILRSALLLAAVTSAGCTNPDAPARTNATAGASSTRSAAAPGSAGEPPAPPAPSAASEDPTPSGATPRAALAAFAALYVNWDYRDLSAEQRELAALSVGAARLAERQAAASSLDDATIRDGQIHNSGRVLSIGPDSTRPGRWVIVTREQTGGNAHYQGLPAGYHVTFARVVSVSRGYAVSEWLPQS